MNKLAWVVDEFFHVVFRLENENVVGIVDCKFRDALFDLTFHKSYRIGCLPKAPLAVARQNAFFLIAFISQQRFEITTTFNDLCDRS